MTKGPFERALVRKGKRALKVARLALDAGDNPISKDDGKVSEPAFAESEIERNSVKIEPISLEEIRIQARENWSQLRQKIVSSAIGAGLAKDAHRGPKADQSHPIDNDLDA